MRSFKILSFILNKTNVIQRQIEPFYLSSGPLSHYTKKLKLDSKSTVLEAVATMDSKQSPLYMVVRYKNKSHLYQSSAESHKEITESPFPSSEPILGAFIWKQNSENFLFLAKNSSNASLVLQSFKLSDDSFTKLAKEKTLQDAFDFKNDSLNGSAKIRRRNTRCRGLADRKIEDCRILL